MSIEWQLLTEEIIKAGRRRLARRTYRMPDGSQAVHDIILARPAVCILALTAASNVILARQFRPGPGMTLLEIPGGGLDDGETPIEGARRELLEETGYDGDLQYVGPAFNASHLTLVTHNFVATNCRKIQEPHLDEGEFIEVVEMPLVQFRQHLRSGQLTDVKTGYLGLDFLGLL